MAGEIRVCEVRTKYETYQYRTPIKFGGVVVDRATILNVKVTVEDRLGRRATGYGSMPLGNVWSYPSKRMTYEQTFLVLKHIASGAVLMTEHTGGWGHPVELGQRMEHRQLERMSKLPINPYLLAH